MIDHLQSLSNNKNNCQQPSERRANMMNDFNAHVRDPRIILAPQDAVQQRLFGLLRCLLVISSVILTVISAITLCSTVQMQSQTSLIGYYLASLNLSILVGLALYHVCLGVLAVVGYVLCNDKLLKLLVLFAGLNLVLVFYLGYYGQIGVELGTHRTIRYLEEAQPNFDWASDALGKSSSENFTVRDATYIWSKTQSYFRCCGLRRADDWALYRDYTGLDVLGLPASCCAPANVSVVNGLYSCRDGETLYRSPCAPKIELLSEVTLKLMLALVWFDILIFIMSVVIVICKPKEYKALTKQHQMV